MQTLCANVHVHVERVFGASKLGWLGALHKRSWFGGLANCCKRGMMKVLLGELAVAV